MTAGPGEGRLGGRRWKTAGKGREKAKLTTGHQLHGRGEEDDVEEGWKMSGCCYPHMALM